MKKKIMRKSRQVKQLDTTGTGFGNFLNVGMSKSNDYLKAVKGRGKDLGKTLTARDKSFLSQMKRKV